jgi:hypothetical protein
MPEYRVFTLGDDGHINGRIEIDCPNDKAALERAKQFVDGCAVELWDADRFIARVDAKSS